MSGPWIGPYVQRVTKRDWLPVGGLLVLSLVPVLAGASRVTQLATGAPITPDNARFFAMPLPVVVHIFTASTFCMLGAFQFAGGIRRRHPRWHRIAGRVLVPSGIAAALAGMWMAVYYPHPPMDDALLEPMRLVFGSAMAVSIVIAFVAILRRQVARHRAWMMRGYAIGIGAGTQVLTNVPWLIFTHTNAVGHTRSLLLGGGWVINLALVEWILRRRRSRPAMRNIPVKEAA
jgi:uncharacterized membrane protein